MEKMNGTCSGPGKRWLAGGCGLRAGDTGKGLSPREPPPHLLPARQEPGVGDPSPSLGTGRERSPRDNNRRELRN